MIGPLPRIIFDNILRSNIEHPRLTAVSGHTASVRKCIYSGGRFFNTEDHSYLPDSVLLVRPFNGTEICSYSTDSIRTVVSPYVPEQIIHYSKKAAASKMKLYLSVLNAFASNAAIGQLFEEFVHGYTRRLKDGVCSVLPPTDNRTFRLSGNILDEHFIYADLAMLSAKLHALSQNGTDLAPLRNIYFRPDSKVSASVDSFYIDENDTLVLLQITVGSNHDLKSSGLTDIIQSFGAIPLRDIVLVFIVLNKSRFRKSPSPITPSKASNRRHVAAHKSHANFLNQMPQYVLEIFQVAQENELDQWVDAWTVWTGTSVG
jgi:hypothetical protein